MVQKNKAIAIFYLVTFSFSINAMQLIEKMWVTKNRIEITVNKKFKQKYLLDDFFAEYDDDIDLKVFDRSLLVMPFVMQVVSLVWISGHCYYIESIDQQLYESLKVVKEVFKRLYPNTQWSGQLVPEKLVDNSKREYYQCHEEDSIALMFSGGLDSTFASLRCRNTKQLLITARGHPDMSLSCDEQWNKVYERIVDFAQRYGHPVSLVRSNYHAFLHREYLDTLSPDITCWRLDAIEGLGWIGLAVPILLSKGCGKLLIASSMAWGAPYQHGPIPLIDDNVKCAGLKFEHADFDASRVQKAQYITTLCNKYNIKKPFIRACQRSKTGTNCCECEKCIRTASCFIAAGAYPHEYGFDVTIQELQKNLLHRLKTRRLRLSRFNVWHYQQIQKCMQKNLDMLPDSLKEYVQHFLAINLEICNRDKNKSFIPINWANFTDLYSAIPQCLLN